MNCTGNIVFFNDVLGIFCCVLGGWHQSLLLTQRSDASKATNLFPSKRFTVQPDWEVTIPAVGVHKYCPRSDCPHGFDKVTVR